MLFLLLIIITINVLIIFGFLDTDRRNLDFLFNHLDLWHEHKEIFLEERETLLQEIATCKDEAQAESLREDLAKTDKVLEIIQRAVPGDPEGTLP